MSTNEGKVLQAALITRIGSEHIYQGRPNQDSIKARSVQSNNKNYLICAVADGHGAKIHDLSAIGSDKVTSAAIDVITDYVKRCGENSFDWIADVLRLKGPSKINARWTRSIAMSAEESGIPFSRQRYGTTLIAALFCEGDLFVMSIGDGNGVASSGKMNNVLWWTKDCGHSNRTCSMCMQDPETKFKFARLSEVESFMLTTDGIVHINDSPEKLSLFMDGVVTMLRAKGSLITQQWIHDVIQVYQQFGMTDDITICTIDMCDKDNLDKIQHSVHALDKVKKVIPTPPVNQDWATPSLFSVDSEIAPENAPDDSDEEDI